MNGPCGIIACVVAEVWARMRTLDNAFVPSAEPISEEVLSWSLARMIKRCRVSDESHCIVASWEADVAGASVIPIEVSSEDLQDHIQRNLSRFFDEGGALLLLYSWCFFFFQKKPLANNFLVVVGLKRADSWFGSC